MSTLATHVHFAVACEPDSNWSITFSKDQNGNIQVGLHWGDKYIPTHVALIDPSRFRTMTETLCPTNPAATASSPTAAKNAVDDNEKN